MGYVVVKCPKGEKSDALALAYGGFHSGAKVVASKMVSGVLYMAVRNLPGAPVVGYVALIKRFPKSGEAAIKVMSEAEGPYYYGCPPEVLGMLGPSDNAEALKWRSRCAERNYKAAQALMPGDKIEFCGSRYSVCGKYNSRSYLVKDEAGKMFRLPMNRRADCNIVS